MSEIRQTSIAPTKTLRLSAGDEVDPHYHDEHQLIYASTGVLEVFVPEGTWFTPSLRSVWVPAGTVHYWLVHGATTVRTVGIPAASMTSTDHTPALVVVDSLMRELIIACAEQGPATTPSERRLLRVLVDRIQPSREAATVVPTLADPRLLDVQRILESDMTDSPSLSELGKRVGASERTLSRLFRDDVGMSYTSWRTQIRLHRATLLLAEGKAVTQAAAACGFSSASAFVSAFRTAFGRTPGSLYR